MTTTNNVFTGLGKHQLLAKIAHDITQYSNADKQAKLSLLQDLIIMLLTDADEDDVTHRKLQSIRCHMNSEDVTEWMDAMLLEYLRSPIGAQSFTTLTPIHVISPY